MSSEGLTQGLFSWMNDFFAWLFSLGMGGKLGWVTQYWPMLVLIIAVFVVIMDLVVWFVRYRPYRNWKRVWDSLLGRSHTTRPAQFTRRDGAKQDKSRRVRSDIPAKPLAARDNAKNAPVTAPLRPRGGDDDAPTAPRSRRAPEKALDIPTMARRPQKQNVIPMPIRSEPAKPAPKPAPPPDDDAPTQRP